MAKQIQVKQNNNTVAVWIQDVSKELSKSSNSKFSTPIIDIQDFIDNAGNSVWTGGIKDFYYKTGSSFHDIKVSGKTIGKIIISPTNKTPHDWSNPYRDDSLQVNFILNNDLKNASAEIGWVVSGLWPITQKGVNKTAKTAVEYGRILLEESNEVTSKYVIARKQQINITKINEMIVDVLDVFNEFSNSEALDSLLDITKTIHDANISTISDGFDEYECSTFNRFGSNNKGSYIKDVSDSFNMGKTDGLNVRLASSPIKFDTRTETYDRLEYNISVTPLLSKGSKLFNVKTFILDVTDYFNKFNESNEHFKLDTHDGIIIESFNRFMSGIADVHQKYIIVGDDITICSDAEHNIVYKNLINGQSHKATVVLPDLSFYIKSINKDSYNADDLEDIILKANETLTYIIDNSFGK